VGLQQAPALTQRTLQFVHRLPQRSPRRSALAPEQPGGLLRSTDFSAANASTAGTALACATGRMFRPTASCACVGPNNSDNGGSVWRLRVVRPDGFQNCDDDALQPREV
jgi:hypothetical protein